MTTNQSASRPIATLRYPASAPELISLARAIVDGMTDNPHFHAPNPSLPEVTAAIDSLEAAQAAAYSRTRGATAGRNDRKRALQGVLSQLKAYVQKMANANPEASASLIESALFRVARWAPHYRQEFTARDGAVSGEVRLTAKSAAKLAAYDWQISTDAGTSWSEWAITLKASTTVTGLKAGETVLFRYRAVTYAGMGDWSEAMAFVVR
jgi:hypothetical protein